MKTKLTFLSLQSGKRARAAGRRLSALLRKYRRDPDTNFSIHSEAAALAVRASHYLRQAEAAGRIILTDHGERRQYFVSGAVPDGDKILTQRS